MYGQHALPMIWPYEWFSKKITTIGPGAAVGAGAVDGAAVVVKTGADGTGLGTATDGLDAPTVAVAAQDVATSRPVRAMTRRVTLRWYAQAPSRETVHGVIYGLAAAVAWGASAIAATFAARRAGTFITVLVGQGIGMIVLVVLLAALRPSFSNMDGTATWGS